MGLPRPREFGPGVRQVVGSDAVIEIGDDDGVALLRPEGARALMVLHQRPAGPDAVLAEADRLSWLDGRAGAPGIVAAGRADEGEEALVVRLAAGATTAATGHPLGPEHLVEALVGVLHDLHRLDISRCPFDSSYEALRAEVAGRVERGEVAPTSTGPYAGRPVAELLELLDALFADLEPTPPVMIHGGLRPDRVWFDPAGGVALTGWRRGGLGDAHVDLAAAAMMVKHLHGPAVVPVLLDAYGLDGIEPRRLDAHQLLTHLLQ